MILNKLDIKALCALEQTCTTNRNALLEKENLPDTALPNMYAGLKLLQSHRKDSSGTGLPVIGGFIHEGGTAITRSEPFQKYIAFFSQYVASLGDDEKAKLLRVIGKPILLPNLNASDKVNELNATIKKEVIMFHEICLKNSGLVALPPFQWVYQEQLFLNLPNNALTCLPPCVSGAYTLKDIDLSCNNFTVFPRVLFKIPTLRRVDLSENKIAEFPNLSSFKECKELELLDLSFNPTGQISIQGLNDTCGLVISEDQEPNNDQVVLMKRTVKRVPKRPEGLHNGHLDSLTGKQLIIVKESQHKK